MCIFWLTSEKVILLQPQSFFEIKKAPSDGIEIFREQFIKKKISFGYFNSSFFIFLFIYIIFWEKEVPKARR